MAFKPGYQGKADHWEHREGGGVASEADVAAENKGQSKPRHSSVWER